MAVAPRTSIFDPFKKKKKKEQELTATPKPAPTPAPPPKEDGGVFTSSVTGKPSGIEMPDGKTYLGLKPEDVAFIQEREGLVGEKALPVISEVAAQKARLTPFAEQVGVTPPIGEVSPDELSYEQAAKSALGLTAAGVVGGAATGAAAGLIGGPAAPVTVPAAAIIGAVVGGLSTFIGGFRGNLKTQRKDMLAGESANIRKQEQNMLKLVMDVNRGGDPVRNLGYFNDQMALINENHERLKLETSDSLSKWLGEDGHTQLERYEVFYSPGGMRDILVAQMQDAILNPDPNKILTSLSDIEDE